MSYLVLQEVKGHKYYYLVKNVRENGGFHKYKEYLGKRIPKSSVLRKFEKTLEQKALKQERQDNRPKKPQFLSNEERKSLDKFHSEELVKMEPQKIMRFAFHTNGIEGSTLSLADTRLILSKKLAPDGKSVREIYEINNTSDAYDFLQSYDGDLSRRFILDLHKVMMQKILPDAGMFRTKEVKIAGAQFHPPIPEDIPLEVLRFLTFYRFIKKRYHPIEVAGLMHVKFVMLHPFTDGNGRVGRLLMNFILQKSGFPPVIITRKDRKKYYRLIEEANDDARPFIRFIGELLNKESCYRKDNCY